MKNIFYLTEGWKFTTDKEKSDDPKVRSEKRKIKGWYNSDVPGNVHTDLLNNKLIPEPFYSDNENSLQWIGDTGWIYKTTFDLPQGFDKNRSTQLVFEGLDTAATIKLNNIGIGVVNNMFRTFSYDVTSRLKLKKNVLEVHFMSCVKYARSLEVKYGKLPVELRSERVYIRKAQYSFGWDWGPTFITMGIWRPVYLIQVEESKIQNVLFSTRSVKNDFANVEVNVELEKQALAGYKIKIVIENGKDKEEIVSDISDQKSIIEICVVKNPKLWWPNGYGEPNLYSLTIQILNKADEVIDEEKRKVGIRTIELRLTENGNSTFQFVINDKPIFSKGANWIPSDSFLPRVNREKYYDLLSKAADANMNIIRVWGGGVYEDNMFYEICDELGLLVWQDFMFACAAYPENEEFLNNVSAEIKENVSRLQHHPSIIIWCGNNENEWIWFQKKKKSYKEMPGYKIYHQLIPHLLNELDPSRPYWPSSPFSFEEDPNSPLSGNRHQWDIWSCWIDYKKVKKDKSLFVTEFGFQSPANSETLKLILPEEERKIQGEVFEFHNKQVEGPERLFKFLSAHLPVQNGFDDFIYLTQLNHGFAMKECLEYWQFRFPATNGAIIWQLNDCWPVSSWAIIDSEMKPKLPYYFVKHIFTRQICGFSQHKNMLDVIALNNSLEDFSGKIKVDRIYQLNGKVEKVYSSRIHMKPLERITVSSINSNEEEGLLLVSTLYDSDDKIVNRNYFANKEWKHMKLPPAKIKTKNTRNELKITSSKPAFFVYLQSNDFTFDDNGFIILPGEEIKLRVAKGKAEKIDYKCLNQYLS